MNNPSKEKEIDINNNPSIINEVKNTISTNNQFSNINNPQQQNNLQAYQQGIQYLLQNNSQANNYLLNQAQIMKNQLISQQNSMKDNNKMTVLNF